MRLFPWLAAPAAAFLLSPWVARWAEPSTPQAILGTALPLLAPLLLGEIAGRAARRSSDAAASRLIGAVALLALPAAAGAILLGRWPALLVSRNPDLSSALLAIAEGLPALVACATTARAEHRAIALDGRFLALRARDRLRLAVAPSAAAAALAAVWGLVFDAPWVRPWVQSSAPAQAALFLIAGTLLFLAIPRLVLIAIPTRPLRNVALRSAFELIAARFALGRCEFRVADTALSISNAALIGGGRRRLVLLTDRLMREHPDDELAAVVGHELGHAKAHHLTTLALPLAALGIAILALPETWPAEVGALPAAGILLVFLALFLRFVVGPIARLCEHEADLFGVLAVGSAEPLVRSLERIASPETRAKRSWRHPSVVARLRFLEEAAERPESAKRPRRRLRQARLAGAALLVAAVGALAWQWSRRLPEERVSWALGRGDVVAARGYLTHLDGDAAADWAPLVEAASARPSASPEELTAEARRALRQKDLESARRFSQLAYLRTGRGSDALLADFAEACRRGDAGEAQELLAGPASFLRRDAELAPVAEELARCGNPSGKAGS